MDQDPLNLTPMETDWIISGEEDIAHVGKEEDTSFPEVAGSNVIVTRLIASRLPEITRFKKTIVGLNADGELFVDIRGSA
ncbi:hypothetical protein JTE90_006904 [Oedothorax gibbosus]|uniref:Uncharacterized protein n=1 Tax=Oedothorax gibbosus TaxID=931172 RepID=A0AAV6VQY0_9ARAC|nr:hypothetical protein JTE90_006904 [Oedothorax gibbosus]